MAQNSTLERSLHLHTDDFYDALCKGAIPPHLPGSQGQNQVVIEAFREAAKPFARGGYDVVVDKVIGPWFIAPWLLAAHAEPRARLLLTKPKYGLFSQKLAFSFLTFSNKPL